jgi:outer membrane autotransporter protein
LVVQGTLYDASTNGHRGLLPMRTEGTGIAGSLEGGYSFRFGGGYFIEPQAQLIYQSINFNDANDNGAFVKFNDAESLIGRIGARLGRTWSIDANVPGGQLLTVWVRPNIWHEFMGSSITQFSSATGFIPFRSSLGGTWGEINLGVSGQVTRNVSLFANASYNERFDGTAYAYDAKGGIRVNW